MEFHLLLVLLLPSVMHQRQPGITEKSNLIQIKLIRVCYSNSANTGPDSNYFSVKFLTTVIRDESENQSVLVLILLFASLSLSRLYDGKSLIAISESPLDRQQLGHP